VLAPKISGAWNLHVLTRDLPLDFFVLFSSAASVFGPIGLANYAAANVFLDALASYRKSRGLPALSIGWGPWEDVGMARAVGGKRVSQWNAEGFDTMETGLALDLAGRLMRRESAQIAVLSVDWPKFLRKFGAGQAPPLFAEFAREAASGPGREVSAAKPDLLRRLDAALPAERPDILVNFVHDHAVRVLGFDKSTTLDPDRGFFDMGMDSLLAVELKNHLQSGVGRPLLPTVVFDHPNVASLAEYLAREILSLKVSPESAIPQTGEAGPRAAAREDRKELSEAELEALLADKIKRIKMPDRDAVKRL